MRKTASLFALIALATLSAGCASPRGNDISYDRSALRIAQRADVGTVESIELILEGEQAPVSVSSIYSWGTSAGSGHSPAREQIRVRVRLDSGIAVAANAVDDGELRIGDRVRVVNHRVFPA